MADWSELLPDLLIDIATCVSLLPDQVSFAGVCQSWHSAASAVKNFNLSPPDFPYLLLADKHEGDGEEADEEAGREFCQLLVLPSSFCNLPLPEARKKHRLSSRGWLLTIGEDNSEVNLLHPFTRQQIMLPRFDTIAGINNDCHCDDDIGGGFDLDHVHDFRCHERGDQHIVRKIVLSCDPLSEEEDCLVMVIWGNLNRLGFCRLGDVSWKDVSGWSGQISDISYHNGLLYGICPFLDDGKLVVCDIHHSNPRISVFVDLPVEFPTTATSTMYVLTGFDDSKLLMVVRLGVLKTDGGDYSKYKTRGFQVFELNLEYNKWSKVESLGDKTIFLGYNSSLWIEADGGSVKPNCVYFSDDVYRRYLHTVTGGGKDMGIFHLSDGIIEPLFEGESCSLVSPPIWVEPKCH